MKTALTILLCWLAALQLQAQCTASFTATHLPQNGHYLRVNGTNNSTYGTIAMNQYPEISINYGDGSAVQNYAWPVTGSPINYDYATPGTYTIWLVAKKLDTPSHTIVCIDSTSRTVTVGYPPCAISISKVNGPGGAVTFTANNLSNTPGSSFSWYFGDGTGILYGNPVTHTYTNNGTYNCILNDTAGSICANSIMTSVVVTNAPLACNNLHAQFSRSINANMVAFSNTTFQTTSTPGTVITYAWDFGDGATSSATNPSHLYAATGTYTVKLLARLVDYVSSSVICQDSITGSVVITNVVPRLNCSALAASFNSYPFGSVPYTINFVNTSTPASGSVKRFGYWELNGHVFFQNNNVAYTFPGPGTYTAMLRMAWTDTISQTSCYDSVQRTIIVTQPLPSLSGSIRIDTLMGPSSPDTFSVWLITFDSSSNLLKAIDSTYAVGRHYTPFIFNNVASGIYRVKAAKRGAVVGSYDLVPTYHDSSLYWSAATLISVGSTSVTGKDIKMQRGTVAAGPGFVGGNVSLGANKGSAAGVPGLTMLLRNAAGDVIRYAVTDANGNYSFTNVAVGTYNVYPEQMNYATTASAQIAISASNSTINNISFNQDDVKMNIKPRVTTDVKNVNGSTAFRIYPNPAHQSVTVSWNQSTDKVSAILIVDIAGKVAVQQRTSPASGRETIDISKLQPGIYFIKMIAEGTTSVHRLTIGH